MNIKKDIEKDRELFDNLMNSTFVKIEIGSTMYGLEHKDSDIDLLCIYNTSDRELNAIDRSHHQIQFKFNNIDYLFINIHSFLSNALSGDSTINFEVINSEKLIGTDLDFLYKFRKWFSNYKIIRSYLGLARRDLKRIDKDGKTEFDKNKKIAHAYRGFVTAKAIFEDEEVNMNKNHIDFIKNYIWKLDGYEDRIKYSKSLGEEIDIFRKTLNSKYDEGGMVTYMTVTGQVFIEAAMYLLLTSTTVDKMVDFDMTEFYDANENDIKY